MDRNSMDRVVEIFKEKDSFLITAHVNPEGDSIGSQLAVYYMLSRLGKKAIMVGSDSVPDNLRFLPGSELIMNEVPEGGRPDAVVVLDCPVRERIGRIRGGFGEEQFIVNIDHHVSNEFFGDINWVEAEVSSVGEMVFHLVKELGIEIEKDLALVLYTAIVTDTGMFSYDNTSSETHKIAGELIARGVNPKTVHGEIFEKKSVAEIRLLGRALTTLQVEEGGRLAYMSLTGEMYREEGVVCVSTDEFINSPRSIKGVEVAVFFKEDSAGRGKINVSFRSSGKIDVNIVASRFGGGGHAQAAGCVLKGSLTEIRDKVLSEVRKALRAGA